MIYFIQMGEDGPIKIGKADDPRQRLNSLQIGCPVALTLLGVLDGDVEREADLHAGFDDARLRGEWFSPVPDLLALIAGSKQLPPVERGQVGRPKAADPKTQRNIYPPDSMWRRVEAAAAARGIKPPDLVIFALGLWLDSEAPEPAKSEANG